MEAQWSLTKGKTQKTNFIFQTSPLKKKGEVIDEVQQET